MNERGIQEVKLHDRIRWVIEGQIVTGSVEILWGDCFGVMPDGTDKVLTITFDMFRGFEAQP
jgi:hypothetical protein